MLPLRPCVKIKRIEQDPKYGTFGVLMIQGSAFCVTLEPPWRMNKPNESCIPPGRYEGIRVSSPKFGETFLVLNVVDRDGILFHPGNVVEDTHGCILLASEFGKLRTEDRAILNSGKTFKLFMKALDGYDIIDIEIGGR